MELDGREIKDGDRMWSFVCGWGEVCMGEDKTYPIMLYHDKGTTEFTPEGKFYDTEDCPRSLFWDEVEILPPLPKQKVKKYQWYVEVDDLGHKTRFVTKEYSEEEIHSIYEEREIISCLPGTEVEVYV